MVVVDGFESRPKAPVSLPTAPRAARGPDISEDKIPTNPPYIAYISNLPYDVEEEDIAAFFSRMNVRYLLLFIIFVSFYGGHLNHEKLIFLISFLL